MPKGYWYDNVIPKIIFVFIGGSTDTIVSGSEQVHLSSKNEIQ